MESETSPETPPDLSPEQRLIAVASTQYGLFTTRQAIDAGVRRQALRTRLERGQWIRIHPRVFAIAGLPDSPARRLCAAVLAGGEGARATHRPGAWLWALTPFEQVPEISIPRDRNVEIPGVRVHRLDLPDDPVVRLGVPTTGVERCLVDLGAVVGPTTVRRALDRAIAGRHTTPIRVLNELQSIARRGRRGVGPLRALLDQAGISGSHPPSVLEAKTRPLFKRAGLRDPDCELVAGANGEYRLDFPYPEAMLNIEVDGWQYHASFEAFHGNRTRQNSLTIEGFAFLRYTWRHVTQTPHVVIREIRAAYNARLGLYG